MILEQINAKFTHEDNIGNIEYDTLANLRGLNNAIILTGAQVKQGCAVLTNEKGAIIGAGCPSKTNVNRWYQVIDEHGNWLDFEGNVILTAEEVKQGCTVQTNKKGYLISKSCPSDDTASTTEDTILGLPKEAVYIGGAVVGFAGLCWLAGRSKKSSALSDKPKRRRKWKAKTKKRSKKK